MRKDMKKLICIIFVWLQFSFASFGQSPTLKQFVEAAKEAMENKDYNAAFTHYSSALSVDDKRVDLQYNLAEAALNQQSFGVAAEYFKKVNESDKRKDYPLATYYLGYSKWISGDYDGARKDIDMYLSEHDGEDPVYTAAAKRIITSLDWVGGKKSVDDMSNVNVSLMGREVNSDYSDIAPSPLDDKLYFSSLRFDNPSDPHRPARKISNIMMSDAGKAAVRFEEAGKIVGHTAFSSDESKVYCTLCEFINSSEIRCDIYERSYNNGNFGELKKLPEPINASGASNTQPFVAKKFGSDQEQLWFVSNRPGGKGGLDIYVADINTDGSFGTPVLASINTDQDDITPYFNSKKGILYFSSLGYPGYGGFDIYEAQLKDGVFLTPRNGEKQLNSSFNDLYYVESRDGKFAYMSSNRLGTNKLDKPSDACCNDIFKGEIIQLNLVALTFDGYSKDSLKGVSLQLIDMTDPDNPVVVTNDLTSRFDFPLGRGRDYKIVASKNGYTSDEVTFSTKGIDKSQEIVKMLYLKPKTIKLDVLTFNKKTNENLNGSTVKLIDMDDPSKEIVAQMDPNLNLISFPIEVGKEYRLIATKRGFSPDTVDFNTKGTINSGTIVQKLYLGRGRPEDYLPLALYFDNDEPEKRTRRTTTSKQYQETFFPYFERKSTFVDFYTRPLKDDAKVFAANEVEDFFVNKVKKGNDDLVDFIEALDNALANGEKLDIVIQGFCSPRASTSYNDALAKRRINSVVNQLSKYSGGKIAPFMKNGGVKISHRAYGERKAPRTVVANIKDVRNSIYSVPASRERRVEIVNVVKNMSN